MGVLPLFGKPSNTMSHWGRWECLMHIERAKKRELEEEKKIERWYDEASPEPAWDRDEEKFTPTPKVNVTECSPTSA
jgi:hypothetical protein